jgi:hypothetical protein
VAVVQLPLQLALLDEWPGSEDLPPHGRDSDPLVRPPAVVAAQLRRTTFAWPTTTAGGWRKLRQQPPLPLLPHPIDLTDSSLTARSFHLDEAAIAAALRSPLLPHRPVKGEHTFALSMMTGRLGLRTRRRGTTGFCNFFVKSGLPPRLLFRWMLSVGRIYAGGWRYLWEQVAEGAEDYYSADVARGEAAGRWGGRAAEAELGLSGEVTEEQIERVFGLLLHPDRRRGSGPAATPVSQRGAAPGGRSAGP